jgi:diketogulonate reductase-like aldo/keto reductase
MRSDSACHPAAIAAGHPDCPGTGARGQEGLRPVVGGRCWPAATAATDVSAATWHRVPRDEVFITTKFYPGHKDPVAEARRSLTRLGVDQVNLYLVHWPQGGATWAWPGMERARELGYARSVGVSNFSVNQLAEVLAAGTIQPAVNQVQFSAPEYRRRLLDACRQRGVALEAYSPLGTGRHLSNETVLRVAKRVGRAPAQVLLRWCVQREVPVITKSTNHERIGENAQIYHFALSSEDLVELDALDQTNGTDLALERKWW